MSRKDLQKDIKRFDGLVISEGTLKTDDLLAAVHDILVEYGISTSLIKEIEKQFQTDGKSKLESDLYYGEIALKDDEEANDLYNEEVFNFMNDLAPDGYYFGSHVGDGSCIGFFKDEEE